MKRGRDRVSCCEPSSVSLALAHLHCGASPVPVGAVHCAKPFRLRCCRAEADPYGWGAKNPPRSATLGNLLERHDRQGRHRTVATCLTIDRMRVRLARQCGNVSRVTVCAHAASLPLWATPACRLFFSAWTWERYASMAMSSWADHVTAAGGCQSETPESTTRVPTLIVRYEQLVRSTHKELARMLDFLGSSW